MEKQPITRTVSAMQRYSKEISDGEIEKNMPKIKGWKLHALLTFCAGAGFTLFGYDQGVMSALITANQFEAIFPETVSPPNAPTSNAATLQSLLLAIYEIGCLIGALSNLWIGDKLGRRKTILLGGCIMIIGAILQTTAFSYPHMIVARIITGMGNGLNWLDFACYWATGSQVQWRFPVAFQILIAVAMMVGIPFLPESPRWLVKHGRNAEALAVITALENTDRNDHRVLQTYAGICEAIEAEAEGGSGKEQLSEIFHGGPQQNFRRVCLGVVNQCFQQISGINLITYYATLLFQRLGLNDVNSRIIAACNGTEYFFASLIAIFIIERVGRRRLMLFGAVGQSITMVLLAILGSIDNPATQIVSAVLLFVFNSIFAVGWLGMTWLYPAEIVGLRIRAPANALSTASNWIFNFMVVMVTGPSFANISWRTYIVFAALNAFIVPCVYFYFPETAGRSLEDMDIIFAVAYAENISPVTVSLRKDLPVAGSAEADEVLGLKRKERGREGTIKEEVGKTQ
ncbi:general substrate transporter [Calocera cornea HHB12733]|uniref:General substrate transporter n=1 Tax=Calocera cornea HHB12733 TaxID=1353952 RepID=A0A165IAV6_9BASI|nr:general substrate transporter [Calocera cornea HHB12733]